MKILHVISGLGGGGAQKLVVDILLTIKKQNNYTADVLILDDKHNVFNNELDNSGINVQVIPIRNPKSYKNISYIRNFIIKGDYDVVHTHLFPTIYWASIAYLTMLNRKKKPLLVMTEHSTHNLRREKFYLKGLEKLIYSQYKKIISISKKTQDNLISWLNPKKEKEISKFVTIDNGVNIEKYKNAIPCEKLDIYQGYLKEHKLLVMVGRFSKQKDQATLIQSLKKLPKEVHLLLIGEGDLKAENIEIAKKIGILDRVHFLGFRKDVERIVKASDVVVLSSNWEGFGLAALEGMAAGKPVIASDVPGLREVVKGSGLLFEKGNIEDASMTIKSLLMDKEKYREISNRCSKTAMNYSIEKMVDKYEKVYEN